MEQFDLVDINDNVIGVTDKQTSHQKGDLHRIVGIYVFNQKGELYLQEHIASGGLYDHSCGGHVIKGETYDQAAKREEFEELNLNCSLNKISTIYSDTRYSGKQVCHMIAIYECFTPIDWHFIPNDEVKNIIPMKIKDVVDLIIHQPTKFTPDFLNTFKEYVVQKKLPYDIPNYNLNHPKYNLK